MKQRYATFAEAEAAHHEQMRQWRNANRRTINQTQNARRRVVKLERERHEQDDVQVIRDMYALPPVRAHSNRVTYRQHELPSGRALTFGAQRQIQQHEKTSPVAPVKPIHCYRPILAPHVPGSIAYQMSRGWVFR